MPFHGSLVALNVLGIRISTVLMQHLTYLIEKKSVVGVYYLRSLRYADTHLFALYHYHCLCMHVLSYVS